MQRLLDFFIVGAQKGGTTALDTYLKRSSFVQTASVKEVHFFDNESLDWRNPDYEPLTSHFDWNSPTAICRGESTPITIYWPNAIERLQKYNSKAKLIVCLRQPSYRAHSHWRMETKRGAETLSFEQAISDVGRSRVRRSQNGAHRVYSYIERGFYGEQVARLRAHFPVEQLLFIRTDDIWTSPDHSLGLVHRFLGIPPAPTTIKLEYIAPIETTDLGAITDSTRSQLNSLYADDIIKTERLTGLSLTDWLSSDYREPMSPNRTR